jgi:large subunit ribosomal protein L31
VKQGIHPDYIVTTVTCSCGNTFTTRSVKPELHVELCNECHPFYTGKQKLVDTGGRVERFQKKYANRAKPKAEEPKVDQPVADEAATADAGATE